MRISWFAAYLALVHLLLIVVLLKSDFLDRVQRKFGRAADREEISDFQRTMVRHHVRMDGNVPQGAVVFIGDSQVQGLCTDVVACPSVNYGIGGDTTAGVLARLPEYRQSLAKAGAVVLAVGLNDLRFREIPEIIANYQRILEMMPPGTGIVCSAVLPVGEDPRSAGSWADNARIRDLNARLKKLCSTDPRCVFVDAASRLADGDGVLLPALHEGDGLHLNAAGYDAWIGALRSSLEAVPRDVGRD